MGEPINAGLVDRISKYVDSKLGEYAAIMSSQAATRSFTDRLGDSDNQSDPDGVGQDEHICNSREHSGFIRFNTTGFSDSAPDVGDELEDESGEEPCDSMSLNTAVGVPTPAQDGLHVERCLVLEGGDVGDSRAPQLNYTGLATVDSKS